MKNIIFYFSGTGNTYWAAKTLADRIGDCQLINIAQYDNLRALSADRVGIFFPVYYWGLPNIIKKFLNSVLIDTSYLYEVHTMGGYDGIATIQLEKILDTRNMKLSASYRIKMPNNIALINKSNLLTDVNRLPDEKSISKLFNKATDKLNKYSSMIIDKQAHRNFEPFFVRPWHSFGYKLNEKETSVLWQRGNIFSSNLDSSCTGCGLCSKVCPVENIRMVSQKPVWGQKCEFCTSCLHACPVKAINYGYSKGKKRYKLPQNLD